MEDILNVFIFDDEEQNDDIEDPAILDIFRDGKLGSRAALYGLFNFENLENAKCFSMFRSKKEHIPRLARALGIPDAVNVNRMSIDDLTKIISPHFTEDTVLEILRKKVAFTDTINILKITIDEKASQKGDSYLSTICRFVVKASGTNVKGKTEIVEVPVIVKFFPKNVARQKTFRSADFFNTEIYFYQLVWPEMKKNKSAKLDDEFEEIPLLLASYCDGKNDFLALEDLSYQGFKPAGRNESVTRATLSVLLQALANFHALGLVTTQRNPQFVNIASNMAESYFSDRLRPWYENFMYNSMGPHYLKAIREILPQEYQDKVAKLFSGDLLGEVIKQTSIRNKLCTVTEGDAWLPNFLIRSGDDGKSTAILIDFQLARYAPITNDLLQFLYSGVPGRILITDWDDLIAEYHNFLSRRIVQLGGGRDYITLKELNEEIRQHSLLGVVMALESTLMSLLTDDEVADLEYLEGDDAIPLEEVWVLPEFDRARTERLAFLVKHLVDKGLIP